MQNLDNLFNNIRYSQELFIIELAGQLETKIVNKVKVNDIAKKISVKHDECTSALKALSIAEIITYEGVSCKHTSITIIDEPMFNKIKERGVSWQRK